MADAVIARWHGDNYQARVFWDNALNLLNPRHCVAEVTFEADGPKSFDDVVVKYAPPIPGSGPERVPAEYHQVKWHVQQGGRFGYTDLTDPAFIGAAKFSLLERLHEARRTAPAGARFSLITIDRVEDGDALAELISGNDNSLLVEKLFDGTTDRSRFGAVRKAWREHLGLNTDHDLQRVVDGLRIFDGYYSLDTLKERVALKAQLFGVHGFDELSSDFRFDALAHALKVRRMSALTRDQLVAFLVEEGMMVDKAKDGGEYLHVAIRSFLGPSADIAGAAPDDTLLLTGEFRQRYLRDDLDWQRDIRPKVERFLRAETRKSASIRLTLDAHASIALLAGAILDLKSGIRLELVQKGRLGSQTWRADDASATGAGSLDFTVTDVGSGDEIAVAVSITQPTDAQARAYISKHLPQVGRLVSCGFPGGPGQQTVRGGEHAAVLSEQLSNKLREVRSNPDARVHLFAACPNAFLFYLGQQHQGIAPCVVYEFDFDRQAHKTYQPSFVIE